LIFQATVTTTSEFPPLSSKCPLAFLDVVYTSIHHWTTATVNSEGVNLFLIYLPPCTRDFTQACDSFTQLPGEKG